MLTKVEYNNKITLQDIVGVCQTRFEMKRHGGKLRNKECAIIKAKEKMRKMEYKSLFQIWKLHLRKDCPWRNAECYTCGKKNDILNHTAL